MVTIRVAQPDDATAIARVHIDSWRTAYHGLVPDAYLAELSYDESEGTWLRMLRDGAPCRLFVAETDDAIVGFALGGPVRSRDPVDPAYQGELWGIYIDEQYRRKGIGRALVRAVVEWLSQSGIRSMVVWCLKDAAARHFYEAIGGQPLRLTRIDIGGATLDYACYGWLDIRGLR